MSRSLGSKTTHFEEEAMLYFVGDLSPPSDELLEAVDLVPKTIMKESLAARGKKHRAPNRRMANNGPVEKTTSSEQLQAQSLRSATHFLDAVWL